MYVRAIHVQHSTLISHASVPTGFMGVTGNKGGVGIRFRFYESHICFVNCHLAAGDEQVQRRNLDYQTIESRMTFTPNINSSSNVDDSNGRRWFVDR